MSKLEFFYTATPITGFFALVISTLLYLPNHFVDLLPQAELVDVDGVVVKVDRLITAERLCREQLKLRYKDDLLSTTLDDHSSRFDEPRALFLIFLQVSVAAYAGAGDMRIHCHVQAGASQVAYLGAFHPKER
jgi:hypothetical protein